MTKFKKNIILKIIVSIITLAIVISLCALLIKKNRERAKAKDEGNVTIIVIDYKGTEISNLTWSYKSGTTLWNVIYENYNDKGLIYEVTNEYGVKLIGIEGIKTEFISGSYLALYCNDEYSSNGISNIELKDGLILKIVETKINNHT